MTKMHQIRFRLALRPRPWWESLQRSPDPLAGFGGLLLREEEGKGRRGEGSVPIVPVLRNDHCLERSQIQISRYYLMLNISETVRDADIVTIDLRPTQSFYL